MATGWNVLDALNKNTKATVEDNTPKARFRTKDISIKRMYTNKRNFYSMQGIEKLAKEIYAVGLLENMTVVHDPCEQGEYRIIAGERRWRALTLLVSQGHTEFEIASCQIKTPAEEYEEMIQLIVANGYRDKTIADIMEEEKQLKETLRHMREQGLTLTGYKLDSKRLRDVIADIMKMSTGKIAQIESINKRLIPELTEELKTGKMTFSTAYEISGLEEETQREMLKKHEEGKLTLKDVKEIKKAQKGNKREERGDREKEVVKTEEERNDNRQQDENREIEGKKEAEREEQTEYRQQENKKIEIDVNIECFIELENGTRTYLIAREDKRMKTGKKVHIQAFKNGFNTGLETEYKIICMDTAETSNALEAGWCALGLIKG